MRRIKLIFSDIDNTIVSGGYRLSRESRAAAETLLKRGYYIVPVTARNQHETVLFCSVNGLCNIGERGIWGVVELGGGVILPKGTQGMGVRYALQGLASPISNFYSFIELYIRLKCRGPYTLIPRLTNPLPENGTLIGAEHILMYPRKFDLLLRAPVECERKVEKDLEKRGFSVIRGAVFLHIGMRLSKRRGVEALLKWLNEDDYEVEELVCLGDSASDLEFISICDKKFTVNLDTGTDEYTKLRTHPDYTLVRVLDFLR